MKKFDELMSVGNEIENISAEEAKKNCPISGLLNCKISLNCSLN